jgi:hypothetical protein
MGGLGGFMSGPWGMALSGLGSLFGGSQSMGMFKEGINDINNMPGMQGPSNLSGNFGTSANGNFQMNPQMMAMQQMLGSQGMNLMGMQSNPFLAGAQGQLGLGEAAGGLNSALSQQMDPMNALSSGQAQNLFNQGQANIAAGQDVSGLRDQQLAMMRESFAPEAQRRQVGMMDMLHSKGLLGGGTATAGQGGIVDNVFDSLNRADQGFQNESFGRGMQQSQFLSNLGLQQQQQGFGAEAQAFGQGLGALQQNQNAAMQRFGAAQGLFGMDQDLQAQRFGLGLQANEGMLGLGHFGLQAARSPFELQSSLLQGGGMHSQALSGLYGGMADANAGFFSGMFG